VEKRLIRWQESVPRHSTQQFREQPQSSRHQRDRSAGGGADFGSNIATDAEEGGEGGPRISAAEENEQERGEGIEKEIPEDPYPSSSYPSISAEHRENKDRLNFLPEFDMPRSVDERFLAKRKNVV
jgi:hypothetical protein